MSIHDRPVRDELTLKAIRGGWGVTEVERAIQAINGPRPHVGKRPKLPKGNRRLMADQVARCTAWVRWATAAEARLPEDLQGIVGQATGTVEEIPARAVKDLSDGRPAGRRGTGTSPPS